MMLLDVSVLVYAHRQDSRDHRPYRRWLEAVLSSDEAFAAPDTVLSGFVRVMTHPRIFPVPTPPRQGFRMADAIRRRPNHVGVAPGARHWNIFRDLCVSAQASGNLVPDAYLAAMAIESGGELISPDRDFARFPGLRWRHPLAG